MNIARLSSLLRRPLKEANYNQKRTHTIHQLNTSLIQLLPLNVSHTTHTHTHYATLRTHTRILCYYKHTYTCSIQQLHTSRALGTFSEGQIFMSPGVVVVKGNVSESATRATANRMAGHATIERITLHRAADTAAHGCHHVRLMSTGVAS